MTVKIVRGSYFDGCTEADTGTIAAKIHDVIENDAGGVENVEFFSQSKQGDYLVATIIYTAGE